MGRATQTSAEMQQYAAISIHALRGEGDLIPSAVAAENICISIHALRGEGDLGGIVVDESGYVDFYPRPPWGGRLFPFL